MLGLKIYSEKYRNLVAIVLARMSDNYKEGNQEEKQRTDTNNRGKTMIDSNMIISLLGCSNNIFTDCITIKYLHNVTNNTYYLDSKRSEN